MKFGSFPKEILEEFAEQYLDFARCQRADGSFYGSPGKCRQGTEVGADEGKGAKVKKGSEAKGLFMQGKDVDLQAVEKKAEEWRKEAGLQAFPGTLDWKHDRVHALVHEYMGGTNKISEWIGHGKTPTPAEETLVNMVHRDAALRARGDKELDDKDLERYFRRDIQFMQGRGNIKDEDLKRYFDEDGEPSVGKFMEKYKEMKANPNYEKLLDAAHSSFTNAGDVVL